ncbi:NifB/NifX family molybdenum-iron cluster-binding protein [Desulfovibrio psychrotolerans]|uniref:Nitrogenase cofactor biosynthesis protein NifB n=1 Tax=Desulfovibrio psychrotolerans TaxID=415242 RepID=A0A7J0BQW3_9BACT|nr:NifB/NifX family molybdenum-iron cluster-binding protein [Desulfovibrio psychrotolerans]GFM36106.1 nitrogenase cofactor biosynthesis protein NifB [Desulfovibrio psychrotolerans]
MTASHPCFSPDARSTHGRLHLPVAPKANVRSRYGDAMFVAAGRNLLEKAPQTLSPAEALAYAQRVAAGGVELAVVGITGPGDPFATPDLILETLRLVRGAMPGVDLCVTTNGLNVAPYAGELAALNVAHVTILMDGVEPAIVEQLCGWIRPGTRTVPLAEAAALLVESQKAAITALRDAGVTVKVNTTVYPGINHAHVGEVAQCAAALGARIIHVVPFLPPWEGAEPPDAPALPKPDDAVMASARAAAAAHLPVMEAPEHCGQMIVGVMGESCGTGPEAVTPQAGLPVPGGDRPNVAVASSDGFDVNEHLGHARKFLIYGPKQGPVSLLEARPAPAPGTGDDRWEILAQTLRDCRYVLVSSAGGRPREVLAAHGIRVIQTEENIEGLVDVLYGGGKGGKGGKGRGK